MPQLGTTSVSPSLETVKPKTPLPPSGGMGSHDDLLRDRKNYALIDRGGEGQIIIRASGRRRVFTKRQLDAMTGMYIGYVIDRLHSMGYWAEAYVPAGRPEQPE